MAQQFAAAPKVVKPKNKYKEEVQEEEEDQIKLIYNNLMWDKRIFRGNTYSAIVVSKKNEGPYEGKANVQVPIRKQPAQTTNAFEGNRRANIQIFTDEFVQSLTDKPPRYEYGAQTEPLPQKEVVRHQMEGKSGEDIQTQIWDNELFDFDYEAEPLLNVLCGRTLQISRMEVLQEQELRIMSNRQQELRLYEKEENRKIQNMYEEEEKLEQENLKVIQQFKKEKDKKIKTHKRVFSRVLAKQYLRDIKINTLNYLEGNGFFRNVIDTRLVSDLMPKLYVETASVTAEQAKYTHQSEGLLQAAKQTIIKEHAWAKEVEKTRRKAITDKRQEKAREKDQRKKMTHEQKVMRAFLAEEKLLAQQEEARKAQEGAHDEGAHEQP